MSLMTLSGSLIPCPEISTAEFRTTEFQQSFLEVFNYAGIKLRHSVEFRKIRIPSELIFSEIMDNLSQVSFIPDIFRSLNEERFLKDSFQTNYFGKKKMFRRKNDVILKFSIKYF